MCTSKKYMKIFEKVVLKGALVRCPKTGSIGVSNFCFYYCNEEYCEVVYKE